MQALLSHQAAACHPGRHQRQILHARHRKQRTSVRACLQCQFAEGAAAARRPITSARQVLHARCVELQMGLDAVCWMCECVLMCACSGMQVVLSQQPVQAGQARIGSAVVCAAVQPDASSSSAADPEAGDGRTQQQVDNQPPSRAATASPAPASTSRGDGSTSTSGSSDSGGENQGSPGESEGSPGVRAALAALRFYKQGISPLMPSACRFLPTCSEYSMGSYRCGGHCERFGRQCVP